VLTLPPQREPLDLVDDTVYRDQARPALPPVGGRQLGLGHGPRRDPRHRLVAATATGRSGVAHQVGAGDDQDAQDNAAQCHHDLRPPADPFVSTVPLTGGRFRAPDTCPGGWRQRGYWVGAPGYRPAQKLSTVSRQVWLSAASATV